LKNSGGWATIFFALGIIGIRESQKFVCEHEDLKERRNMKKLLALLFALALSVSMSSFAFAQATGTDKPADQKEEKKEKKTTKTKKAKKDKKDEMKKDETKKDEPPK
jgi:cell division protein FtsB